MNTETVKMKKRKENTTKMFCGHNFPTNLLFFFLNLKIIELLEVGNLKVPGSTGCAICFGHFPIVLDYRKAAKTYGGPCIPYFGLSLGLLNKIELPSKI